MDLLSQLNPEQKQAVTHDQGPLLIIAGAGTGKTTVITQKIAWLIQGQKAKPEEILAVTFTEKAAGEMEERVDKLLPYGYVDLWISTFHSFAQKILEAEGLDLGLPNDFKLLNATQTWMLVRQNLEKFNLDYYRPLGNPTKFIHALLKHFSRCKDELVAPADYLKYAEELRLDNDALDLGLVKTKQESGIKIQAFAPSSSRGDSRFKKKRATGIIAKGEKEQETTEIKAQEIKRLTEVANAYHVYQKLLLDNNVLDFGDLINYCLKLFQERPQILNKYRQQFKYILVDEFQDTNYAQYQLIKLLAAPKNNLTVVADDDQSIFKFRGASVSNILEFKRDYPDSANVFLTANYRSRQNLLDLSYDFIQQNNPDRLEYQLKVNKANQPGVKSLKLKEGELSKKLRAANTGQAEIKLLTAADSSSEVRLVIEQINKLRQADKEFSWNEVAILVRANDYATPFLQALGQAGAPVQFLASTGLYAKPVILDIIAYLKLLDNYHESPALYRVLSLSVFQFSHHDLINLNHWAQRKSWSLYETLKQSPMLKAFSSDTLNKINKVFSLIEGHTQLVREKNVGAVILAFLEDTGYLKYLSDQEEAVSRQQISYLNQFYRQVKEFEQNNPEAKVKAWLAFLDYQLEAGDEGSLTPDLDEGPEAIKILTVHAAKGLEFKYVFIVNLVDRRFPSTERRDPIELPDALVKETLPTGDVHLQEERRLFYVAMTRAKQGIYFTAAENYGGTQRKKPSRFLTELRLVTSKPEKKIQSAFPLVSAKGIKVEARAINCQELIPKEFSYTQLRAFSTCPYQYRFAHILKVPTRGRGVFSYGKTIHLTLQRFFQLYLQQQEKLQGDLFGKQKSRDAKLCVSKTKPTLKELLTLYEQSWLDDWYESQQQKEAYFQQGREVLKRFYQALEKSWPEVKYLERKFHLKITDPETKEVYRFKGVIDREDAVGKNQYEIIDYKTGEAKSEDKLTSENRQQLLIYQLAAKEVFQEEIKSLTFYYVDGDKKVSFLGSEQELVKQKELMIKTIKEIKQGQFPPKPGYPCRTCDFKGICEFRKL